MFPCPFSPLRLLGVSFCSLKANGLWRTGLLGNTPSVVLWRGPLTEAASLVPQRLVSAWAVLPGCCPAPCSLPWAWSQGALLGCLANRPLNLCLRLEHLRPDLGLSVAWCALWIQVMWCLVPTWPVRNFPSHPPWTLRSSGWLSTWEEGSQVCH